MSLVRTAHPRQAVVLAVVVGLLAALMGRAAREVLVAGGAVLLTQLILGMVNDLLDQRTDAVAGAERKPLVLRELPAGNVTFLAVVLVLLAIPMSLQNGAVAGLMVLATLPVGFAHNRFLKATPLSFLGWAVTFALFAAFLAYGGWGLQARGGAPTLSILIAAALLGICVHFAVALPGLSADHAAGVRGLPLRVALKTGAPRLLVITIVATVLAVGYFGYVALAIGIAQ